MAVRLCHVIGLVGRVKLSGDRAGGDELAIHALGRATGRLGSASVGCEYGRGVAFRLGGLPIVGVVGVGGIVPACVWCWHRGGFSKDRAGLSGVAIPMFRVIERDCASGGSDECRDPGRGGAAVSCHVRIVAVSEVTDIERLRALRRISAPEPARRILMDALGFLHYENPHSDFLAWLLDPRSDTDGTPLLRALLEHAGIDRDLGKPQLIDREVVAGGDRPDIVVSWGDFTLVIENKVWSNEGDRQCARYLASFEIHTPAVGRLVYLNLGGKWPPSVRASDPRVVVLSYVDLLVILRRVAETVADTRTRVLIDEYAAALEQLTARETMTDKPKMSSSTREYVAGQEALARIAQLAHQESEDFIRWTVQTQQQKLREILGDDLVCDKAFGYAWVFRRKAWQRGGLGYGVAYSSEVRPGRRLLPDYQHLVGLRVQPIESADVRADHPRLTRDLVAWLRHGWSNDIAVVDEGEPVSPDDLRNDNRWWAWYRSMPPRTDEDWSAWSDRIVNAVARSAETLTASLDRFAAGGAHPG